MNSSLYIGYSGSISNSMAMNIVGDNIANINTTGFKGSSAEFSTLFENHLNASTYSPVHNDIGTGSRVSSSALDLSQGTIRDSDNIFNMAINGEGWFGVTNGNVYNSNDIAFTRDGLFSPNSQSYLVNSSGNYLLGSDYGLISQQEDGSYVINSEIDPIAPSSEAGKQDKMFVPKELSYPHTVTTSATLQKNLYSQSATQTKQADVNNDMDSLLTSTGELMGIQNGDDMLFSAGTSDAIYNNGRIEYSIYTTDAMSTENSSATFNLNGSVITASWEEGSDSSTVAAAIKEAIDLSSPAGVSASLVDNSIKLTADQTISITDSDYETITPVLISKISYQEEGSVQDGFSSLDDMSNIINSGIENVYGAGSAEVFLSSESELKVAAKERNIILDFKAASQSNDKLLTQLNPLNGETAKNSISVSKDFNMASSTSYQKIVDEDGNENLLYVGMSQISPKDGVSGSTWKTDVKIVNKESATELTDVKDLLSDGKEIGLMEDQDMWFSIGSGDIRKTTFGYDYAIKAPSDIADGTGSSLSFDINGSTLNLAMEDGSSSLQNAQSIVSALAELGISATANYDEVLIHADSDTPTLSISNGTSTLSDFNLPDHTLQYARYGSAGDNTFSTLEDINTLINSSAQSAGIELTASTEDSTFKLQNNGNTEAKYGVLQGLNSNSNLLNILTPSYNPVQPGQSSSSNTLESYALINEVSENITFDTASQLNSDTAVSIKNGTKDLVLDLSNMTNFTTPLFDEYFSQNGELEGAFESYDINQKGQIVANFSNAKSVAVSEVSLYHFQNDQGLAKIGSNQFIESANSGKAFFYLDSDGNVTNGSIIESGMLENSNVSTEKALTEMIVLQRAFESSAKIITTSDELLKNAINMKR